MGGYCYGEEQPTETCPFCSNICEADFVDIGVGFQQCGPYHCEICGASEIGPNDKDRTLSDAEKAAGWYGPNSEPSSSANMLGGKIVSHRAMRRAYNEEFSGNPLYAVPGEVEKWREQNRK